MSGTCKLFEDFNSFFPTSWDVPICKIKPVECIANGQENVTSSNKIAQIMMRRFTYVLVHQYNCHFVRL